MRNAEEWQRKNVGQADTDSLQFSRFHFCIFCICRKQCTDILLVDLAESTWIFRNLVLSGSSDPDRKWTLFLAGNPMTLLNSQVNLLPWCWSFMPKTVSLFLAFALESLSFDLGLAVCLQPCISKRVFPKNTKFTRRCLANCSSH